ncbi:hypothetical protein HMPREF0381_0671, partial [Lachnoanaerobaculum saburreum DSM 3986]
KSERKRAYPYLQEYAPNVKLMTLRIYTAFGVLQTPIIILFKRRKKIENCT